MSFAFQRARNAFHAQLNRNLLHLGDYEVNRTDEKRLGRGEFGSVWRGKNIRTKEIVAVKQVERTPETQKFIEREIELLQKCKHENIVKLYEHFEDKEWVFFVMEYCGNGNLDEFMKDKDISIARGLSFMKDVTCAVDFLHTHNYLHRDIKPENILVRDNGRCVLADLALSRYVPDSQNTATLIAVGTEYWMAPEVLGKHYGPPADIFSLGLVILAIVTHQKGQNLQPHKVKDKPLCYWMDEDRAVTSLADDNDDNVTQAVKALVLEMICFDSSKRPTMKHVHERILHIIDSLIPAADFYFHASTLPLGERYHTMSKAMVKKDVAQEHTDARNSFLFFYESKTLQLGKYEVKVADENILGVGTFGLVWYGTHAGTKKKVAVKQVITDTETEIYVRNEKAILTNCTHENIVKLYKHKTKHIKGINWVFFIMEYCDNGDLDTFMEGKDVGIAGCLKFMQEVASAITYLHTHKIGHRDIKPTNILVRDNKQCVLADLGQSRYFLKREARGSAVGTNGWQAPEIRCQEYGLPIDIFSFGLVILALIKQEQGKRLEAHKVGGIPLCYWMDEERHVINLTEASDDDNTRAVKKLVLQMLKFKPEERLPMGQVLECIQHIIHNLKLPCENKARTDEAQAHDAQADEAQADEAQADEALADEAQAVEAAADEEGATAGATTGATASIPCENKARTDEAQAHDAQADEAQADEAQADEAQADEALADEALADEAAADEEGATAGATTGATASSSAEHTLVRMAPDASLSGHEMHRFRQQYNSQLQTVGKYEFQVTEANKLGEGGFGFVWLGKRSGKNEEVAVKQVLSNKETATFISREVDLLKNCKHKNIVKLYEHETKNIGKCKWAFFIMEYCRNGNLNKFVTRKRVSKALGLNFIKDVTCAVKHMHSNCYVHRDIKPANILVRDSLCCVLADLGLSRDFPVSAVALTMTANTGTAGWMAPEVFPRRNDPTAQYGRYADIFSLGLVILAITNHQTGRRLKAHKENDTALCHWMDETRQVSNLIKAGDDDVTRDVKTLVQQMIRFKPDDRPTIGQVLKRIQPIIDNLQLTSENEARTDEAQAHEAQADDEGAQGYTPGARASTHL